MALTLARCALTAVIKNSIQLERTHLPVERKEVFLHSFQAKTFQIAHYH